MTRAEKDHPLYRWRKAHGRSLTSLAGEVGCKQPYLSEIENRNKQPSLTLATRLQRATQLPVTDFLKKSEPAQ